MLACDVRVARHLHVPEAAEHMGLAKAIVDLRKEGERVLVGLPRLLDVAALAIHHPETQEHIGLAEAVVELGKESKRLAVGLLRLVDVTQLACHVPEPEEHLGLAEAMVELRKERERLAVGIMSLIVLTVQALHLPEAEEYGGLPEAVVELGKERERLAVGTSRRLRASGKPDVFHMGDEVLSVGGCRRRPWDFSACQRASDRGGAGEPQGVLQDRPGAERRSPKDDDSHHHLACDTPK